MNYLLTTIPAVPHQQADIRTACPKLSAIRMLSVRMDFGTELKTAVLLGYIQIAQEIIVILCRLTVPAKARSTRTDSRIRQYYAGIAVLRLFVSNAERLHKELGFHAYYSRH